MRPNPDHEPATSPTNGCIVLGIETSCDETAAAVVHFEQRNNGTPPTGEVLSNVVLSQADAHQIYGGVVPEIAARSHVESADHVIAAAMRESGLAWGDIDAVAGTAGPGLIGGLIVGLTSAKALALALGKPFLGVNHLEGHALTVRMLEPVAFPYLLLLVSGGHTQLVLVRGLGDYQPLGSTIDDAAGEAFDKTAKLLGLGYPGGPAVEMAGKTGNPKRFDLPRPLTSGKGAKRVGTDFSFAGLKTAVRQLGEKSAPLTDEDIADLCAGFQAAVADCLVDRTQTAIRQTKGEDISALVVAGGVAANQHIRNALERLAGDHGLRMLAPPLKYCGDNAAMIAWAAAERFMRGERHVSDLAPRARWPLTDCGMQAPGRASDATNETAA